MPVKVLEIELSAGLRPIRLEERYDRVFALIRLRGRVLGCLRMWANPPTITTEELQRAIWEQLNSEVIRNGLTPSLPPVNEYRPRISVIVCTRNRSDDLRRCLKAVCQLSYPNFETIVVDNAPTDNSTASVCAEFSVRRVCEPIPGLDNARNRGIHDATGDIVAFVDDDAEPDALWLIQIADSFADASVMAVSGFVAPAELETDPQVHFEFDYGGMGHGFRRRRISRDDLSDRELLWASSFGVGTNMAFRKSVFEDVGFFDVTLDVGTPSGGGGDVEMLHRIVARGHMLVYEPSAIVWHTHRRNRSSFRRQLYQNGTGFGAYLITCARNRTVSRASILKFATRNWLGGWIGRRLVKKGTLPRRYVLEELRGALASPFAYGRSRKSKQPIGAN